MKRAPVVLVVIAAAGLPGAAATAPTSSSATDPKALVLQLRDVPAGFERTTGRYVSNAQANRESSVKKNYAKLGRITGYEAEFEKEAILGILQISSTASTYKTAAGAHNSIRISVQAADANREVRFRRLSVGGRLGHEAYFHKATMTRDGTKVDVFAVTWRTGRIYAGVLAAALAGSADPADVVALARKQQSRIAANS
jgi:hypothetical protein